MNPPSIPNQMNEAKSILNLEPIWYSNYTTSSRFRLRRKASHAHGSKNRGFKETRRKHTIKNKSWLKDMTHSSTALQCTHTNYREKKERRTKKIAKKRMKNNKRKRWVRWNTHHGSLLLLLSFLLSLSSLVTHVYAYVACEFVTVWIDEETQ